MKHEPEPPTVAVQVVHEAIRKQGDEELNRPVQALAWSGSPPAFRWECPSSSKDYCKLICRILHGGCLWCAWVSVRIPHGG